MTMKDWLDEQIKRNQEKASNKNNSEKGTRTPFYSGKAWAYIEMWEAVTGKRHPDRGVGK